MKASKLLKAYLWAEIAFMAYLVLKPKNPAAPNGARDDIETRLKETLENGTQDP